MKEMVGGCCVCSDERGWPENPLVYCDGQNCTVAVHQACYGIVTVPTGPWYCRKCESQERSARVRCELCPSRDGALKKTDNQGWAHVVCALYIPEVRFGNVTTMEPIILQLIPPERYAKTCYICRELGKANRSTVGACMQCNKSGCKMQFHVTCAQALGLLCEEAGNYLDNVKYCGYCQYHYSKLKKGGNVKTIPPYKPVTHETGSSDSTSSPEKELEQLPSSSASLKGSSSQSGNLSSKQRKSNNASKLNNLSSISSLGNSSSSSVSGTGSNANTSSSSNSGNNKTNNTNSSKDKEKHNKSLNKISNSNKNVQQDRDSSSSSSSTHEKIKTSKNKDSTSNNDSINISTSGTAINSNSMSSNSGTNLPNSLSASAKESLGMKFTTSNFTEAIVANSESIFGSNEFPNSTGSSSKISSNNNSINKKRKVESVKCNSNSSTNVEVDVNKESVKDLSFTLVPLATDKTEGGENDNIKTTKKPKTDNTSSSVLIAGNESSNLENLTSSSNSSNISSHIKTPILKDETHTRSNSPYTSSTSMPASITSSGNSSTNTTTPSLYVSVPLSTANVPGVNLPSATSNISEHINQIQSRSSPIVNSSHHHSNNLTINLNSQSLIERQSPRINQGQQHHHYHSNDHHNSSSSLLGATQASSSPLVSHTSGSGSSATSTVGLSGTENNVVKMTYEKQNLRVTQLQEEQTPARRSRSQSGDSSSKSRSGKKRSAGIVVSSISSSLGTGNSEVVIGTSEIKNISDSATNSVGTKDNQQIDVTNQNSNITAVETSQNSNSSNSMNVIDSSQINQINSLNTKQLNKKMLRAAQYLNNETQQSQNQTQPQLTTTTTATVTASHQTTSNDGNVASISTTSSTSRTPDMNHFQSTISSNSSTSNNNSSLNNGGLKFTYESQIGGTTQSMSPSIEALQSTVKDSPPSSPGSEAGSTRKRGRKSLDNKDIKLFHNGVHATHMLGNQLNPASSVAQKMTDQLNMEIEDHSVYTQSNIDCSPQLIGVPFPGKQNNNIRNTNQSTNSISSLLSGNSSSALNSNPQSLEQLLERQWEQGSQFLMEQAQHFDIASLLSCLHQLRTENVRLEDHVNNLIARRDHLLAVNARLAIPLTANISQNQASINNIHINGPTTENTTSSSRVSRANAHFNTQQQQQQQQQMPIENGIDFRHTSQQPINQSTIRHSSSHLNYPSSTSSAHSQPSVLSSSSSSSSTSGSSSRHQHSISGSSMSSTNSHQTTEQMFRSGRGSTSNLISSINLVQGGNGGGGSVGNYHSTIQQSTPYIHQSQLRRDDNQGKPS